MIGTADYVDAIVGYDAVCVMLLVLAMLIVTTMPMAHRHCLHVEPLYMHQINRLYNPTPPEAIFSQSHIHGFDALYWACCIILWASCTVLAILA